MIVTYTREQEANKTCSLDGSWDNKVCVHNLIGQYHWTRIDDNHILLKGAFDVSRHKELHEHPDVTVLPSIYHTDTVDAHVDKVHKKHNAKKHYSKIHHKKAVHKIAGHGNMPMTALVDHAADKYGPMFGHAK